MGMDGLSILLVLLTTFLTPISILSTWTAVEDRVKDFMIFFLLLEVGMTGRLPGTGPVPVLRLLGIHPGADVLPDRDLGRPPADVRGRQVLPLHHGWLAADAAGDPVAGHLPGHFLGAGTDRHEAVSPRISSCGSSWPLRLPLRSRSPCGPCTPGSQMLTSKRPPPVRSSWQASC